MALVGIGAAPAAASQSGLCIPLFGPCGSSSPTPTPTSGSGSGSGSGLPSAPGIPAVPSVPHPGSVTSPGLPASPQPTPAAPVQAGPDAGAPVFTQPAAQLGSSSLSFSGLRSVGVVTVPLADGSRIPVLKIVADSITIDGFSLTVRKQTGPVLATTADRMALRGNVQVYLDSATATTQDGKSLTLGASTPPPQDGLPPTLLKATLGLVGVTADSITFTNPHQHLSE